MRRVSFVVLACLLVSACSPEMSGPEPQMDETPEDLATTPSFVCNEDPGLWVTLDGEDFSPLVFDAIASDEDHDVELPTVTLRLRQDPTGAEADQEFSTTLESPPGSDDGAVRWHDDKTMQFFVSQELDLPEGLYEISVENPNGRVVNKAEAFGVLDRPSLETAIPELTCVAQEARDVVLEGDNLMVQDNDVPTLRLNDEQVEVVDTDNCRELHSTFVGHELCEEVTVRLDEGSFDAGVYDVTAENFAPAGCASDPEEDGVTVTVNDPPQPEAIAPTPICSEQLEYEAMDIDGEDFVVVRDDAGDEIYPTVEVGDRSYDAIAADGCTDIETAPALGAERCTQVTIAIEADDLAEQVPTDTAYTDLDIVVTNPEPVGCHSTDEVLLTAVPPPSVELTEPDPMCTEQFENTVTVTGHGFVSIDGAEPVVHVGDETYEVASMDDCTDVPTPEADTASCETVTIVVPEGDLDPERTDVTVENPETAACESTEDSTVQVVPPPTVVSVSPQPICTEQEERTLQVEGEEFLDIDGALPTVTIGDQDFEATEVDDCDELPLDEQQRDVRRCETLSFSVEEGLLDADVHDVAVTNPEPAHCESTDEVTVETVPPPTVAAISPTPVCSEQIDYAAIDVDGGDFVVVRDHEGEERYPTVSLGSEDFEAFDADGCTEIETNIELVTERCEQLTIAVDDEDLAAQVDETTTHTDLDVVVTNPDPIGCSSTDELHLTAVPPPSVATVAPDPMCTSQYANTVTVSGQGFLSIDGAQPVVHAGSETYEVDNMEGCTEIETPEAPTNSCDTVTITVPTGDLEGLDRPDVTVENPPEAGCQSTDDATVRVVPPPTVAEVTPDPVCVETDTRSLSVEGADFLDIDGALPTVAIGGESFDATSVNDCQDLEVDDTTRTVQRCSTLSVAVDAGAVGADEHDLVVTNPEGAQCASNGEVTVETVDPPVLSSVDPRALCTDEETTTFELTGENFYEIGGVAPAVMFDNATHETDASNCSEAGEDTQICSTLRFDVDPSQATDDVHHMVAINPDPIGCQSEPSDPLVLAGPPQLVTSEPEAVCQGDSIGDRMTLFGQFVYDPQEDKPEVEVSDETTSETADVIGLSDCETTVLDDSTLDTCTELEFEVPVAYRDQAFDVTVKAPEPVACGEDTLEIEQLPRPDIETVEPERICVDGGSFHVTGEHLREDAEYKLDGIEADDIDFESEQSVTVFFDGTLPEGEATLEIINPGDCGSTYSEQIRVTEGPDPVYVDPPATFDGMTTQVTIYAAGLHGGSIEDVALVHPDGTTTGVEFTVDEERSNVVQATIPEGMLADTEDSVDFGIELVDNASCNNDTSGLVTITSELTVAVEAIDPPFGGTDDNTGVDIFAEEQPEGDMVQFEAVPRAYLSPSDPEEGEEDALAREIRSLEFIDETELNGIVPSGLPVGDYDLVVVNPDGAVGALFEAFEVTADSPPTIESVSPGAWETNTVMAVDVEGTDFREQPMVEVFCRDPGDEEGDFREPASIDVTFVDGELVELVVDTDGLEDFDACFMRLTNPDDTYGEYSPITVTNPAGNFVSFNPGTPFDIARRAPTAFSGTPSPQARFLYVVGGDDGNLDEPVYSSGEFSRLDRFGAPGDWQKLPYPLPTGRTLSNGVRIDDFVYLVGGYDIGEEEGEETVTSEILRARVLDPLDVPEIDGIDLFLEGQEEGGEETEFEPGVYYYRVSAVYDAADEANPEGESLGSEAQPIQVPEEATAVSISWDPPEEPNHVIAGYHVYRSVEPDQPFGDERLLETIDDPEQTSFKDDGTGEFDLDVSPLPLGSLGTWHHVSDLLTPRMVAGITTAPDPEADDTHYIYAIGGEDHLGDFRADYEYVGVEVQGPRQQEVDALATLGMDGAVPNELDAPRAEFQAVTGHSGNASNLSGAPPQVFTLGGQSGVGDSDNNVYVTSVTEGGALEAWTQLPTAQNIQPSRFGHGGAALNNSVVLAGGAGGEPDDQVFDSEILCDLGGDCPPAELESDTASQGDVGMEERVWMGDVPFRGFWYLTGGLTTGDVPTNTVDFTVAGGTP